MNFLLPPPIKKTFANSENNIPCALLWFQVSAVVWVLSLLWGYAMAKAINFPL